MLRGAFIFERFGGQVERYNSNGDYHPGEDWNLTTGTDNDEGQSVYAIADGVILFSDCVRNYGNTVIIIHRSPSDEFITSFYGHLENSPKWSVGTSVDKGDLIGKIGKTTDASCNRMPGFPAHLHFEIRRGSMVRLEAATSRVTPAYDPSMWPAAESPGTDNGSTFIQANYYPPSEFLLSTVATSVEETGYDSHVEFSLAKNFPNPFNLFTTIKFNVPAVVHVRLEVFDMLGRKVATLVDVWKTAGQHMVTFDANDLPSGVYVYRLRAGSYSETKAMILSK